MHSAVTRLQLFTSRGQHSHPLSNTIEEVTRSADHLHKYSSMLEALHGEFSRRSQYLITVKSEMHMVSSPLNCSMDNAPSDVQMELTDLQYDTSLAEHFRSD